MTTMDRNLPGCDCRDHRLWWFGWSWLTVIEGLAPYGIGFGTDPVGRLRPIVP
jgi:hypothetical protein